MILGFVEAAAPSACVDSHLLPGVRWDRYVEDERRRDEVDGRTSCRQHRAAACEESDMLAKAKGIGIKQDRAGQKRYDLDGDDNRYSAEKESKFRPGKSRSGHVRTRSSVWLQAKGSIMMEFDTGDTGLFIGYPRRRRK